MHKNDIILRKLNHYDSNVQFPLDGHAKNKSNSCGFFCGADFKYPLDSVYCISLTAILCCEYIQPQLVHALVRGFQANFGVKYHIGCATLWGDIFKEDT